REPQDERRRRQDRPVDAARALCLERRIVPPDPQQIAMERVRLGVELAFAKIELASCKRLGIARVVERRASLVLRHARKLREKFGAALLDGLGELGLEIAEVQKRRRRRELLTLEQH